MNTEEKYVKMLDSAYNEMREFYGIESKLEYIGDTVFDITTYDSGENSVLEKLTLITLEVIDAISNKKTFEYIKDNSFKYMLAVNMTFLKDKIEWGTSIRGAWINNLNQKIELDCGRIIVEENELPAFMKAILKWINYINSNYER